MKGNGQVRQPKRTSMTARQLASKLRKLKLERRKRHLRLREEHRRRAVLGPFQRAQVLLSLVLVAAGCQSLHPPQQQGTSNLRLKYAVNQGVLTLNAEAPFRQIACVRIMLSEIRTNPNFTRAVWEAKCADETDCTASVRYGDESLQATTAAKPLGQTRTGECYACYVTGSNGYGSVMFSVDEEGGIEHCGEHQLRLP